MAEGSDLAGSIRIPAALCGVVGLKPIVSRVARYPAVNAWTSFSCVGPMARTVRDVALLLSVMAGPDERDPQSLPSTGEDFARAAEGGIAALRVAWSGDLGYVAVDPEVRRLTEAAAKRFASFGCVVEDANPGVADPLTLFNDLTAPLRAAATGGYVETWKDQMESLLVSRIAMADGMSAVDFERASHRRTALWQTVSRFFHTYDLLLTPATTVSAFAVGTDFHGRDRRPADDFAADLDLLYVPLQLDWPASDLDPMRVDDRRLARGAGDRRSTIRRGHRAAGRRCLRGCRALGAPAAQALNFEGAYGYGSSVRATMSPRERSAASGTDLCVRRSLPGGPWDSSRRSSTTSMP